MAIPWTAIGATAAAATTTAGGIFGAKKRREHDINMQDRQTQINLDLQEYGYNKELEQWNRANEYNSPAEQMKRLEEAGLNKNLIYGTGAGGAAAGGKAAELPKYQAPKADYTGVHAGVGAEALGNTIGDTISKYSSLRAANSKDALDRKQVDVAEADRILKGALRWQSNEATNKLSAETNKIYDDLGWVDKEGNMSQGKKAQMSLGDSQRAVERSLIEKNEAGVAQLEANAAYLETLTKLAPWVQGSQAAKNIVQAITGVIPSKKAVEAGRAIIGSKAMKKGKSGAAGYSKPKYNSAQNWRDLSNKSSDRLGSGFDY